MDCRLDAAAYEECLHRHGLKSTRTRNLVLCLLYRHGGVLTAEEIYQELTGQGQGINVSTVYRILEMFTAKELTEKHYLPDSRKYGFSLRTLGHRHCLICLKCRRIVEIDHCPLPEFEKELADKTQFDIVGHNLEWYGYCPDCRRKDKNPAAGTAKPAEEE